MKKRKSTKQRLLIGAILILFVLNTTMLTLALPQKAKAAAVPTVELESQPSSRKEVKETILDILLKALTVGGMRAVSSVLHKWTQQLAYDIATSIATAEWGKAPSFFTQDWEEYLKELGEKGAGEFIGTLSESFEKNFNIDLCEPALPSAKLKIVMGLENKYKPKDIEPKCRWSKIKQNWQEVAGQVADLAKGNPNVWRRFIRENMQAKWDPAQNDIGAYMELSWKVRQVAREKEEAGKKEREDGSFKPITDLIGKDIQTPDEMVQKEMEKASEAGQKMTDAEIAAAYGAAMIKPEGLLQVFSTTLVNTFVNTFSKRVLTGFFDWADSLLEEDSSAISSGGIKFTSSSPEAVKSSFEDFLIPPAQTVDNYNILGQYKTCPDSEIARGVNHCVIDPQFAAAVEQARTGVPLTVREAIEQGFISGEKKFASKEKSRSLNRSSECWSGNWLCYQNLVKLRKARIVPVGWEIAAEFSKNGNYTLNDALEQFDDTGKNNVCGDEEGEEGVLCGLVDPNWVLKYPLSRCNAQVYGQTLFAEGTKNRQEVCADEASCLYEDAEGNCSGGYGYCTREKNIWRFEGEECSPQYVSCQQVTRASDGKSFSYVLSSVDELSESGGICGSENVGCKNYSLQKDYDGNWIEDENRDVAGDGGEIKSIFLNKNILEDVCSEEEEGCTTVSRLISGTNLLINGGFELGNTDGWQAEGGVRLTLSDATQSGSYSGLCGDFTSLGPPYLCKQDIISGAIEPETPYTLSFSMNTFDEAIVRFEDAAGQSAACELEITGENADGSWHSHVLRGCTTSDNINEPRIVIRKNTNDSDQPILFDDFKLETGTARTQYSEFAENNKISLKVAPDYYDCQDYNKVITGIDDSIACANAGKCWRDDIGRCVESDFKNCGVCRDFAFHCEYEDIGCDKYEPVNGDPAVTAIARQKDQCPEECAGYNTFSQEATYFEEAIFPTNLIPDTADICRHPGCDEFTNLDKVAAGGEGLEYYSFLRQCQELAADCATFYTWEGSDTAGYQLQSYSLKADDNGHPAEIESPLEELGECRNLDDARENEHCKEFYNTEGQISYRIYEKTITCSDNCHRYRRTQDREIYMAIPGEGVSCRPQDAGCREYVGNAGRNIRIVDIDDFEDGTNQDWNGQARNSTESYDVAGHSLFIPEDTSASKQFSGLVENKFYQLSFWAKTGADSLTLNIDMFDEEEAVEIEINNEWQLYKTPIIQYIAEDEIEISIGNSQTYFDNIILKELTNSVLLIENSWTTPQSCDSPDKGAMLGCQEYTDSADSTNYLKSFSRICSEDVVGCKAFINTQNSDSPLEQSFTIQKEVEETCRLWIKDEDGTFREYQKGCADLNFVNGEFNESKEFCTCQPVDVVYDEEGNATDVQVIDPNLSCRIDHPFVADDVSTQQCNILQEEIEMSWPADKITYLVDNFDKRCTEDFEGCRALGELKTDTNEQGEKISSFENVYFKVDPDKFENTLCQIPEEGCEEYAHKYRDQQAITYFKDPGEKVCEFKEEISHPELGQTVSGWVRAGTENEPCACEKKPIGDGIYQFYGWVKRGTENTPCSDPSVLYGYGLSADAFNLLKFGESGYGGWVGMCPAEQSGCTEFTSTGKQKICTRGYLRKACATDEDCDMGECEFPDKPVCIRGDEDKVGVWPCESDEQCGAGGVCGDKYHYIYDADLDEARGECTNTEQNLKEGCAEFVVDNALFTDTNNKAIFKVERDRVCGEWLACRSKRWVWSSESQEPKEICEELARCDELSEDGSVCTHWVRYGEPGILNADQSGSNNQDSYYNYIDGRSPDDFAFKEPSGYSIPGMYPVEYLKPIKIEDEYKLAFSPDTAPAGGDEFIEKTCRAYPEKDSPFPKEVDEYRAFGQANICEEGNDCDCYYKKVKYGPTETKYYGITQISVPNGICQGGLYDGEACLPGVNYKDNLGPREETNIWTCGNPEVPGEGGSCLSQSQQYSVVGRKGYCLEYDQSLRLQGQDVEHPCITWLPTEPSIPDEIDAYTHNNKIGYVANENEYYCLVAETSGYGKTQEVDDNYKLPFRKGCHGEWLREKDGEYDEYCERNGNVISDCCTRGDCNCKVAKWWEQGTGYIEDVELYTKYTEERGGYVKNEKGNRTLGAGKTKTLMLDVTSSRLRETGRYNSYLAGNTKGIKEENIKRISFKIVERQHSDWPSGDFFITKDMNWQIAWCSDKDDWCSSVSGAEQAEDQADGEETDTEFAMPGDGLGLDVPEKGGYDTSGLVFGVPGLDTPIEKYTADRGSGGYRDENGDTWSCGHGSTHKNNFFLIRALFDDEGNFEGFEWGLCDGSSARGGIEVEITFHLDDFCKVLAQTTDIQNIARNNKSSIEDINRLGSGVPFPRLNYLPEDASAEDISGQSISGPACLFTGKYYTEEADAPPYGQAVVPPGGLPDQWNLGGALGYDSENKTYRANNPYALWQEVSSRSIYSCGIDEEGDACRVLPSLSCQRNIDVGNNGLDNAVKKGMFGFDESLNSLHAELVEYYNQDRLMKLFTKIYGLWQWTGSKYELVGDPTDFADIDRKYVKNKAIDFSAHEDFREDHPKIEDFEINGETKGNITNYDSYRGSLKAELDFYVEAESGHGPLRKLMVNWGDGSYTGGSWGKYANRKKDCGDDEDCIEGKFEFEHIYFCKQNSPHCPDGTDDCWEKVEDGKGYCLFNPAVLAVDNWGWCVGRPISRGKIEEEEGFHEDGLNNIKGCSLDSENGWYYFDGLITVHP